MVGLTDDEKFKDMIQYLIFGSTAEEIENKDNDLKSKIRDKKKDEINVLGIRKLQNEHR